MVIIEFPPLIYFLQNLLAPAGCAYLTFFIFFSLSILSLWLLCVGGLPCACISERKKISERTPVIRALKGPSEKCPYSPSAPIARVEEIVKDRSREMAR